VSAPNQAQAEFWSEGGGRKWVEFQDVLDATLAPALNLLMEGAALRPGQSVLDIGCGAGASSLAAAEAVGSEGQVTGVDISAPLLQKAARRAASLPNVSFARGDAQTCAFPARHDALISRFDVMFFGDPAAAFANMARALRSSGQITFVCWAGLDMNPWFLIPAQIAARHLGAPDKPALHAPGPMAFADVEYTFAMLERAGLRGVTITPHQVILTPPGDAAQVAAMAIRIGPAASRIAAVEAGKPEIARIQADITRALAPFQTAQGVRIPAALHLCQARVSEA